MALLIVELEREGLDVIAGCKVVGKVQVHAVEPTTWAAIVRMRDSNQACRPRHGAGAGARHYACKKARAKDMARREIDLYDMNRISDADTRTTDMRLRFVHDD